MNKLEIYSIAEEFLELVYYGNESQEELERSFILSLDKLSLATNYINYTFDENEYPDPPASDSKEIRKFVQDRFSFLGDYNTLDKVSEATSHVEILTANAIDDISDIVKELKGFIWYWNNTSIDEALWQFKFSYDTHWGRHLRELQLYLFTRARGL